MKIREHNIPENQGKQKNYDVNFYSDDEVSNYHGENNGVPTRFIDLTKDEVIELSTCFKCISIEATHYPNMRTRTILSIKVEPNSANRKLYESF